MKERIRHIKEYLQTHKRTIIIFTIVKLLVKAAIVGYLLFGAAECKAQSVNKMIRSGNSMYHKGKYNNATEEYTKALQKDPNNGTAYFNQADALYQLKEYQQAKEKFNAIVRSNASAQVKAKAYYNLGNCYYKQEKYEDAVKAYKSALKLNPEDKEAKYNLMMAMAKVKNNKKGGGKNDQDNKQQQNKNQQNQNQNQQQKDQQNKMSDEEAKRLLEALGNEENKVQQKLEKKKGQPQDSKVEKDW